MSSAGLLSSLIADLIRVSRNKKSARELRRYHKKISAMTPAQLAQHKARRSKYNAVYHAKKKRASF